jgi:cobalt/nickel transport protein
MTGQRRRVSTKMFALAAILIALVLGGVVSYYASGSPDGLNRVAEDKGFIDEERASATADSPLADYSTRDVANERLSGGLAGAVGVAVVLVVAGGLALVVRRQTPSDDSASARQPEHASASGASRSPS